MPALSWREEFAVGVAAIDQQHRRLIEMLATFYEALSAGDAREALGELLRGLLDYTRYHFSTEERLMEDAAYALRDAHHAQHEVFLAKVTEMQQRFSQGQLILSLEATGFIRDWLSHHILVIDKELGRYLRARGVR
jgi:hemerythrin